MVGTYCCCVGGSDEEGCGGVGGREGAEAEWEEAGDEGLEESSGEDGEEEIECDSRRSCGLFSALSATLADLNCRSR